WTGLWLLCALLSKEVAYAAAAVMLARIAVFWWRRRDIAWGLLAAVMFALLSALTLRALSGTTVGVSLDIDDPLQAVVGGVVGWWRQAPSALSGFMPMSPWLSALIV